MKLNASDLERLKACSSQVDLFRQHFGEGGTVTLAKVRKVASLFDWDWAASALLSKESRAEYERAKALALAEYERAIAPARAEYRRAIAKALVEYERATAPPWAEYERAIAPALAEYKRAKVSARDEYERAKALALAEYERAIASAWFAGWKKDHSK